jgi:hypothetical protein
MRSTTLLAMVLATVLSLSAPSNAHDRPQPGAYKLTDDLSYKNFFSSFDFFSGPDPTQGFVQFQNLTSAIDHGLVGYLEDTQSVFMGVDYSNKDAKGRASVRLESKKAWNHGLLIADIHHMPHSECGVWPALWLLSANETWPLGGEIDLLEGVNDYQSNSVTLHTSKGCVVDDSTSDGFGQAGNNLDTPLPFTGSLTTGDCDVAAEGQGNNVGCSIHAPTTVSNLQMGTGSDNSESTLPSYGTGFNKAGGGIYAMEWTSISISVWFLPRNSPFSTNATSTPDPTLWGTPMARFSGTGCDFEERFKNLKIIFDTTFCGEWAGMEWDKSCATKTGVSTCEAYVRDNPEVFKEAFWEVANLRWYQKEAAEHIKRETSAVFIKAKGRYHRA